MKTENNASDSQVEAIAETVVAELAAKRAANALKQKQWRDRKKIQQSEKRKSLTIARAAESGFVLPKGVDLSDGKPDTLDNCYRLLEAQPWGFSFDQLRQEYTFRGDVVWPEHFGRVLTDKLVLAIKLTMIDVYGVEFSTKQVEESIMALCDAKPFNPVVEYLDAVQMRWDGVKRVSKLFPTYFGAPDDEYTCASGSVFMVGAVARARVPGCKFDTMPILEGPPGSGKSSALAILGGEWYSDAELGDLNAKDAAMVLRGAWIFEVAEMAGMRRSDMNTQKAFISRQVDRYRPAYAKMPINQPRQCVFVGSYNPDGNDAYLTDPSGERRKQPIATGKIDLIALARDRDQLWAEASQMYADGYSTVIPKNLFEVAAEMVSDRMPDDPWTASLAKGADSVPVGAKLSTQTILQDWLHIDTQRQSKGDAARLGPIMRRLGFKKVKIGKAGIRGWEKLPDTTEAGGRA